MEHQNYAQKLWELALRESGDVAREIEILTRLRAGMNERNREAADEVAADALGKLRE